MKGKQITDDAVLAVYDTVKKRLIGVFKGPTLAATYLHNGMHSVADISSVRSAWLRKGTVCNSRFSFPIAIRSATLEQSANLKESGFWLHDDYPDFKEHQYRGFVSSRIDMAAQANEMVQRTKK